MDFEQFLDDLTTQIADKVALKLGDSTPRLTNKEIKTEIAKIKKEMQQEKAEKESATWAGDETVAGSEAVALTPTPAKPAPEPVTAETLKPKILALHTEFKEAGVTKDAVEKWHREVCLRGFEHVMLATMTQEELNQLDLLITQYTRNASAIIAALLPDDKEELGGGI